MNLSWRIVRARLFGPGANFSQDFDEEIQAHLEIAIDENIASGMSPSEARTAALRRLGDPYRVRERAAEAWSFRWFDELAADIRFASRMLIKNPGFTVVAVLTLALGIGATSAIFSVIDAVLIRSLPYPDPNRLVILDEYKADHGSRTVSWLDFRDWQNETSAFETMAAYRPAHTILTGVQEPALLRAAEVSSPFFDSLGVLPLIGRDFRAADDTPGAAPTVVVSYPFWRNRLHGDPDLSGRVLDLDGVPHQVVGVTPPSFHFFDKSVDVYLPVGLNGGRPSWNRRGFHPDLMVLARLRRGDSIDSARSQLETVMQRLDTEYPQSNAGMLASITPLYEYEVGRIRPVLLILLCAVGCVLLIAAINVANLLLARGTSRDKEMAIRVALGAGTARLVRQLLTESLMLSLIGSVLGLVVAVTGLHLLLRLAPASIPRIPNTHIDARVVLFTFAVAVATGLLFGIIPALQAAKLGVNSTLQENSRGTVGGRIGKRVRSSLLIVETAFALVLVVAAGLLIRSLLKATSVDPGFRADNTLALDVMLPPTKYPDFARQSTFYTQAVERLAVIPGVQSVGAASCPPLVGVCASNAFSLLDQPVKSVADLPIAASNIVVPGYFQTLRVPLMQGRFFSEFDNQHSRLVAIVNRSFAQRWWPNVSPIGKLIREGGPERNEPWREIVGVVADVKQNGMDAAQVPEVFFPAAQYPFAPWDSLQAMTFAARTNENPTAIAGAAKSAIWMADKDLPITAVRPIRDYLAESLGRREFTTVLLSVFGLLALVLAAVGIYGVIAFNVSQQQHEIAIRMALGAQTRNIRMLVFGHTTTILVQAVVLGSFAAWIVNRWIKSLLFGVRAADPLTFFLVFTVFLVVAAVASYVPMRRAVRIHPAEALRTE